MVGDDEVIFLNADGDEVQVIELGGGVDAHARVSAAADDLGSNGGVGQFLPVVAVNGVGIQIFLPAQVIRKNPGAGAMISENKTDSMPSKGLFVERFKKRPGM